MKKTNIDNVSIKNKTVLILGGTRTLGTALRSGDTAPSFLQFLESTPWTERYTSLSPSLRPGGGTRRFNPTARYMYR